MNRTDKTVAAALLVAGAFIGYISLVKAGPRYHAAPVTAPIIIRWGDLGRRMMEAGVIDRTKFLALYKTRGRLSDADMSLIDGGSDAATTLSVRQENAGLLINLLWALGLGNANPILEDGPMKDRAYGGAGNFASTGGWTLARGSAMDHYGKHTFIALTPSEQALVEHVAKSIYRPCCDNPTYFPDCNHGMAMLGLLELMASQGASEAEMYRAALALNSYWFPEQYATIARYFKFKGAAPESVEPKEILGATYSSASGFRQVAALVPQEKKSSGGGCGV